MSKKHFNDPIYKITKDLYDSNRGGSVSAAYTYATAHNLKWKYCPGCEVETPTYKEDSICLVCWTSQTTEVPNE